MEKKFDNIDFFIFLATDSIFRQFWFSLLISLKKCLYFMCVKAENFSWLLRVARAKAIGRVLFMLFTREISWQARPREIGLRQTHFSQFLKGVGSLFSRNQYLNFKLSWETIRQHGCISYTKIPIVTAFGLLNFQPLSKKRYFVGTPFIILHSFLFFFIRMWIFASASEFLKKSQIKPWKNSYFSTFYEL